MKINRSFLTLVAALTLATGARAHHDVGDSYDSAKTITLKGTVTNVEWKNPHVRIHLDGAIKGRSADSMDWQVELSSPNLLALNGLKINSLRPGDHVTVSAYPARDGSNQAYGKKVTRDSH